MVSRAVNYELSRPTDGVASSQAVNTDVEATHDELSKVLAQFRNLNVIRPLEECPPVNTLPDMDIDGTIFTTQPQTGHPSERTDGQTECIFTCAQDKRLLTHARGYPRPLPKSQTLGGFEIKPTKDKGLGMFATRDYDFGDMILAERPLILCPMPPQGSRDTEYIFAEALDRMSEANFDTFMSLHNCHTDEAGEEGDLPLFGVLRTNAYYIRFEKGKTRLRYISVYGKISRINHSCSPNTSQDWDALSLSRQIYALRPIKKGEEITSSYMRLDTAYAERQRTMNAYGIICTCEPCSTPKSFLTKLNAVKDMENITAILKWCQNALLPDDLLLKPTLGLLELIEKEGQQEHQAYRSILMHLSLIYYALGEEEKARMFMEKRMLWDQWHGSADEKGILRLAAEKVKALTKHAGKRK
ncbi:hypothetical protein ONZ45_g10754 [Pleurotus djamor]|nr:hypothetical protein ONZ45_g10754 [Pleurotus djamor]